MREVIWHKDPETGRYTVIKPWGFGIIAGLTIGHVLRHLSEYHFGTKHQALSALGDVMGNLLAATIGVTTVAVVVLASRMFLDRRRTKLASG